VAGTEGAKTDQLHAISFGELASRRRRTRRWSRRRRSWCPDGQCDSVNQFLLVHIHSLGFLLRPADAGAWRTRHHTGGVSLRQIASPARVFDGADARARRPAKTTHEVAMIVLCRRPPFSVAPRREPPDPASTAVPSDVRQHCSRSRRHARDPERSTPLLYPLPLIDVADRSSACAMREARLASELPVASNRAYVPILGATARAPSAHAGVPGSTGRLIAGGHAVSRPPRLDRSRSRVGARIRRIIPAPRVTWGTSTKLLWDSRTFVHVLAVVVRDALPVRLFACPYSPPRVYPDILAL
jgi:hypothetical protein